MDSDVALGVYAVLTLAALVTLGMLVLRGRASDRSAAHLLAEAQAEAAQVRARAEADVAAKLALAESTAAAAARDRQATEEHAKAAREDLRRQRDDLERRSARLHEREERLERALESAEARERALRALESELAAREEALRDVAEERQRILERAAGLTAEQARAQIVAGAEQRAKRDAVIRVREIERVAQEEGDARAREVITSAIQRVATEQTTEAVVTVLHLPSDDMKGRIIGREGRNIRAFEAATGVNLIVDDTPEAVLLSSFDPVRREVARTALEALVLDGRIQPHRIEESVERAQRDVDARCLRAAEDAVVSVGVHDLHPELVTILGRLHYRTSYGQNVLKHLVESAHLAGLMAAELGLDPGLLRRCAFLHDIGKALTHESLGSHALVGADLARKYGEEPDVVHAIEAHHNEVEPRTVEAVLVQAADAVSGGRPGARREPLDAYVKRMERLEEIAAGRDGVEKVYAMQAGRELRVMVLPDRIDDIQAQVLAREIAKQIEDELTYPGQIRVVVVRESRATEVAR
ncbi:ribonuclease Y [Motilibacter aurantiacus]|uniref:ribonuclease Y n=1 Tax=Motilibacter aurantiacus TaxID=2714955 RepID=UPI002F2B64D9